MLRIDSKYFILLHRYLFIIVFKVVCLDVGELLIIFSFCFDLSNLILDTGNLPYVLISAFWCLLVTGQVEDLPSFERRILSRTADSRLQL